jgi:hypothetical protein
VKALEVSWEEMNLDPPETTPSPILLLTPDTARTGETNAVVVCDGAEFKNKLMGIMVYF